MKIMRSWLRKALVPTLALAVAFVSMGGSAFGQSTPSNPAPKPASTTGAPVVPGAVEPPPGYVIGPEDVLAVVFWREKDLSVDAAVRPDGRITVPLLNDLPAAGLTPDQLRERIQTAAAKFVEDPSVTVVVKAINSRKVFITGMVEKPGPYPLTSRVTVVQLIAMAGGLREYAEAGKIVIMRSENGRVLPLRFDYTKLAEGRNVSQNVELRPGDTVIVP